MFDCDINVVVSVLHLKNDSNNEFSRQGSDQDNGSNLSENQECEQVSQFGDSIAESNPLKGYFCSKTVFNLTKKVLTETEIKVLEKRLDFPPIQKTLNEPELRKDFEEFSRRMRYKWHFRNEVSENFSEAPSFRPKSVWKPAKGHASLKVFLSRLEKELFSNEINEPTQSNLSGEEWKALRALAADKTIVIKAADKVSSVVVWDRSDYLQEASSQFEDKNIYDYVRFSENVLIDLVERSNKIFKYFKKATNLEKLYFLPKRHKRLYAAPGRPVV